LLFGSITMHRHGTRGTSILEAVATLGFVGVAVLGFSMNSVSLARANKVADSTTAATALAQQKIEELRNLPLGAAQLSTGSYTDASNPLAASGAAGRTFTRAWTVSAKDQPRSGLKTLTVTVAWTDSRAHTARLAAFVRCSRVPCP